MGVLEIERAVASLGPDEFAAFRSWFEALDQERFEQRIAEDAAAGKLDRFANEAIAEHRAGVLREL